MAKTLKPKEAAADGILDDTAPQAEAAVAVPDMTPVAAPVSDEALPLADRRDGLAEVVPVITVRAMQSSRWRTGRCFGAEPVTIPVADLTEAEIAALTGDPLLVVTGSFAPA